MVYGNNGGWYLSHLIQEITYFCVWISVTIVLYVVDHHGCYGSYHHVFQVNYVRVGVVGKFSKFLLNWTGNGNDFVNRLATLMSCLLRI